MNTHPLGTDNKHAHIRHATGSAFKLSQGSKATRIEDLPGPIRRLHRKEHLFQIGSPVNSLYVVCGGALKYCNITPDGDEQVVAFYRTGDMLAFDAIANDRAYCNVVAIDATVIRVISANTLLKACRESAELQRQLLEAMNREIHRLTSMLQLERRTAEQRVAAFLLEQSDFEAARGCSRTDFILPMSRTDLANYLNLATETISRTFSRLQAQGLLATGSKRIYLKNRAGIRQLATMASARAPSEQLCA